MLHSHSQVKILGCVSKSLYFIVRSCNAYLHRSFIKTNVAGKIITTIFTDKLLVLDHIIPRTIERRSCLSFKAMLSCSTLSRGQIMRKGQC